MVSLPVRERLDRRFSGRHDQIAYPLPPTRKLFEHSLEGVHFRIIPLRRNLARDLREDRFSHLRFDARDPRLERVDAADGFIHTTAGIEPAERRIRKVPFACVETEALIDHLRVIVRLALPAEENRLTAVRVARPFVECEHAAKIAQVQHLAELLVGKEIVYHGVLWRTRIPRAK